MKMKVLLLLLVITSPLSALQWDVMVASEEYLESLLVGHNVTSLTANVTSLTANEPFGNLLGLALDAKSQRVFFSRQNDENATIFAFSYGSEKPSIEPIARQSEPVVGLAFEPISSTLFWTTGMGRSIMLLKMNEVSKRNDSRNLSQGHTFLRFKEGNPQGIAVDSCGGYVYWSNIHEQASIIERARFDGSDHKKVITEDLYRPNAIAVDPIERRLYWGNARRDIFYTIESSNLDGLERKTLVKAVNNQPFAMAVNKDFVFWTDWANEAVWAVEKEGTNHDSKRLHEMRYRQPMGIVANAPDTPLTEHQCKSVLDVARKRAEEATSPPSTTTDAPLGELDDDVQDVVPSGSQFCLNDGAPLRTANGITVCRCLPGFTGARCEVALCHNLCVNGECSVDSAGAAVCKCNPGFSGPRCERNVCTDFCLNDGCCRVENGQPKCKCPQAFTGSRCEVHSGFAKMCRLYCEKKSESRENENNEEDEYAACVCDGKVLAHYEYNVEDASSHYPRRSQESNHSPDEVFSYTSLAVIASLSCLSLILFLCVLYLGHRVLILRKRPRIKRQFIGNKPAVNPTPLTARPSQATDMCEISIENCCNMNICETPCFEPNLRTVRPGSKKEEKKVLLANMEQVNSATDDLY